MLSQPIRAVMMTAALIFMLGAAALAQENSVFLPLVNNSKATPTPTKVNGTLPTPTARSTQPTATPNVTPTPTLPAGTAVSGPASLTVPVVFVSRQIPPSGSIYWSVPRSIPGVGPWSRFQVAAPSKLVIRESDGRLRVLIDGANPNEASLNLSDVNAPDVSYDGSKIVFAGLPKGVYETKPLTNPDAWRIYVINVDGTELRQLSFSDLNLNYQQFGQGHILDRYDDTDPVWLPDGRIVFSSTRWPSYAMYSAAHTTNLYVMNADGSNMHRITAERNGAERPVIDPLTGRIVYSRWWRNFRMPTNSMETVTHPEGGYKMKDGLVIANGVTDDNSVGGKSNLKRNAWHLATIKPDGTDLQQFAGGSSLVLLGEDGNAAYGGSFANDGVFYANFFPMKNMTEAAGFGGIRRYTRGPNGYTPIIGINSEVGYEFASNNPVSYGVYKGNYATDPLVLPDGRLLISWAADINQDYGLYTVNADGSDRQLLYDVPGMTELRSRLVAARPVPPVIADLVTQAAAQLPPLTDGPYDIDGIFTFHALNVYFNGPVDSEIVTGIPVGSASTIRFFVDHQRNEQIGSKENVDWPILLKEMAVNPDGSVINREMPANLPLFEQIRSSQANGYLVPLTGRTEIRNGGAGHVAGLNFGRPGDVQTCVGCHSGHSMLSVPANPADAQFTNLAPSAAVNFSSVNQHVALDKTGQGLIDRKVMKGRITDYWRSDPAQPPNQQWVQLSFPVPVTVRNVRLYGPRPDPADKTNLQVNSLIVRLYSDAAATREIAYVSAGPILVTGTDAPFPDVKVRTVRVEFTDVQGTLAYEKVASLAEIEVIARGEAD